MTLDVEKARRETPACRDVIHFNNAGAALMPRLVVDAITSHVELEARMGGYEAADAARDKVNRVYAAGSAFLNCREDEIAFTDSATRAWVTALGGMAQKRPFAKGDRILVSRAEYASNHIAMIQIASRFDATIEPIGDTDLGELDVDALENMIDEKVRLIALTHVPTNGGLVNPAEEVGKIARKYTIAYFLDACQSAGQIPLDVADLGCDILSMTGRKYVRGPRGTGLLYVRRSFLNDLEPMFPDLTSARLSGADSIEFVDGAKRFETFETNIAGKIALGVALDYADKWGLAAIEDTITNLAENLRQQLAEIPAITLHDQGKRRCGIVTFSIAGREATDIKHRLTQMGINVHVSYPCATWFDSANRDVPPLVRASLHYYNTKEEVTRLIEAVKGFH